MFFHKVEDFTAATVTAALKPLYPDADVTAVRIVNQHQGSASHLLLDLDYGAGMRSVLSQRGAWTHDVSYAIISALDPDDRRAHERELLGVYKKNNCSVSVSIICRAMMRCGGLTGRVRRGGCRCGAARWR